MKCLSFTFFCCMIFQLLHGQSYTDSLDTLIDKKISSLGRVSKKVKNMVYTIKTITKKEPCLQQIDDFLERGYVVDLSCLDVMDLEAHLDIKNELQDLKNALHAKLYLYYLECAQQKMLYIAAKNYDALWYWHDEQFQENKYFYQRNVLRWFLRSQYQIKIENNIATLQAITKKTNSFLGLLRYNQRSLKQAQNQEEFKKNLLDVMQLQDDFFYHEMEGKEIYMDGDCIKKSTMQVYDFSQHISQLYGSAVLPSHIQRHWQSYAVVATIICASAFFCKKYEAQITQGSQYFWEYHVKRPFEQFKNMVSGLTHIPTLGTAPKFDGVSLDEDNKILEELIEVGAKIPQVNGLMVSLDQANAELLHEATGGEFAKQYQQIKGLVDKIDADIKKIEPIIGKVEGSIDNGLEEYKKFQIILPALKQHLVDFENQLAGVQLKIDREGAPLYADPLRLVVNEDRVKSIKTGIDAMTPTMDLISKTIKTMTESNLLETPIFSSDRNLVTMSTDVQESLEKIVTSDFTPLPPLDTSSWTFEQKKQRAFENDRIILAHPEKNIKNLAGAYHRMVMRQLVDTKEQMNKSIYQTNHVLDGIYRETDRLVEEIYTDNRLVLGVVALVPIATVCGSSLFASNKIYSSVAYRPIRKFMYHIEVLLNESFYKSTCFEKEGSLYFLTEQLKLHIGVLTFAEQKLMEEDIASLQSASLDYIQKFNVVQRMYRTYPCLATGIV